jgi:hypothetical protein
MTSDDLITRIRPRRQVRGSAAALLPFEDDGRIAVEAFQAHLAATHRAGLTNAVNMDTGYANYLSATEKSDVLQWTREALGPDISFIAGAYIEGELHARIKICPLGTYCLSVGAHRDCRCAGIRRRCRGNRSNRTA